MNKNIALMENENAFTILSRAQELEKQGKKIINLGIGQPDFTPPQHIIDEAIHALKFKPHGYTDARGLLLLREEISKECFNLFNKDINPENILISPGGKPIIYITISLLSDVGDEIIISNPSFPIYKSIINYCGAKTIYFDLKESNNFNLIAEDIIQKINKNTKLIILNTPCNPTGSIMNKYEIKKLLHFLNNYNKKIYVLSDEIYSKIIFNNKISSIIEYSDNLNNIIVLNGLSKSHSMTGWRIGWGIFPNKLINDAVKYATNIYSCVNNFSQFAAAAALNGSQEFVSKATVSFKKRTTSLVKGINKINGFKCVSPEGAFYCYPNINGTGMSSTDLQNLLLEKLGIASIDGNNFGIKNDSFLRLSCCTSQQDIDYAISILENYFNKK
tara:strand:+ start:365 stop:1528 length:1164 start_codon:yes stop_codon:yes gene_type:complete